MLGRILGILLLVLGAIGVIIFVVIFLFSILMVTFPGTQSARELFEAGAALTVLSSPLGIVGVILLFIGWRTLRHARRLETLRALLLSHPRVEVAWLSRQLKLDAVRTRSLLLDALNRGRVRGEFASENVFVSGIDPTDIRTMGTLCARCGATAQFVARAGQALACPYCGWSQL
jgi:hypothetical protein